MDWRSNGIFKLYTLGFGKKAERKTRKKRSIWTRQIDRQREESGIYHTSVQEIPLGDIESYFKWVFLWRF